MRRYKVIPPSPMPQSFTPCKAVQVVWQNLTALKLSGIEFQCGQINSQKCLFLKKKKLKKLICLTNEELKKILFSWNLTWENWNSILLSQSSSYSHFQTRESCFENQVECRPLVNTFEQYCKPFASMFLCQGDCGRVKTDFFISKRLYTKQFIHTVHVVIL